MSGPNPLHHRIDHAIQVSDEQLARMVAMDIATVIHLEAAATDWVLEAEYLDHFGPDNPGEEIGWLTRWRDFVHAGLHVAAASDTRYMFPVLATIVNDVPAFCPDPPSVRGPRTELTRFGEGCAEPSMTLPIPVDRAGKSPAWRSESGMDTDLVVRAQHGDEEAFASLAVAAGDRLHAVAHRILRDTVRRVWTPTEILELLPTERTPPGTTFSYAETNYLLLSLGDPAPAGAPPRRRATRWRP